MSSEQIIGDTSHLTATLVPFNAVYKVTGKKTSGHFRLTECLGFASLLRARASVRIVSSSLTVQVIGPARADKSVNAYVAIVPASLDSWPTTSTGILTIGGSTFVQHSLYIAPTPSSLLFNPEVAHQIKPTPVIGQQPEVVYLVEVIGGEDRDESLLRISGQIDISGVGFVPTWV